MSIKTDDIIVGDIVKGVSAIKFYDFPLCLSFVCSDHGEIQKMKVSYRAQPSSRSKKPYGKKLFEKPYVLDCKSPLTLNSKDLLKVVQKTLEYVMPRFFLPALFDQFPTLLNENLNAALAIMYAWEVVKTHSNYAEETLKDKAAACHKLIALYKDKPISYLTPTNVKPDLDDLAKTSRKAAQHCIPLLKVFFAGPLFSLLPTYRNLWEDESSLKYHYPYSPQVQTRNRLQLPILTPNQSFEFMERCEDGIRNDVQSSRYFAAALMFVDAISLDEACALTYACFSQVQPDKYYLSISKHLVSQDSSKRTKSPTDRQPRHLIQSIADPNRLRNLPMGTWITEMFSFIQKQVQDSLLLHHSRNKNSYLSPKAFSEWLDKTFGDIVSLSSATRHFADYLRHTAPSEMEDYGMLYEERRHLEVKAHRHTDTRYYADFNYYDELEKLAAIQDLWLANLRPLALNKNHAQHILEVPGRPGHIAACQVRLTIRPDIPQDALILLLAKFGGKAVISSTTLKT